MIYDSGLVVAQFTEIGIQEKRTCLKRMAKRETNEFNVGI